MNLNSESAAVKRLRVLIVDDHPMVREGLAGILSRFEITISDVAANGQEALQMFSATRPDVTLLDLRLPDQRGLDVLKSILKLDPNARVVILTSSQVEANIYDAISLGACGYLLKGIDGASLAQQIRHVAEGGRAIAAEVSERLARYIGSKKLSEREIEVLRLIALGKSNKEISQRLDVTVDTIKMHVKNLIHKLQASDRTQAVVIAIQRGLIQY
jgi:DNA-binding NarL/FixJ family response regulator